jgi:membrane-bound serine protease (ClpP class)
MRHISRLSLYISIIFILIISSSPNISTQTVSREIVVIDMEMTIDYGASDILSRVISTSGEDVAAIIIRLNTNGGYLQATENIVDLITRSPIRIIVYIPIGGRAFSAGAYIAVSSELLVMSPGSVIGSAEPRSIGGIESDPKIVNAMASWMESLARYRGRNETAAINMVYFNADYAADKAVDIGLADYVVGSLNELLEMEGYGGYVVREVGHDVRSSILSILSDPFVVGLLIDIAALLILIEVFHPTYLGGLGAAVAFVLALLGLGLVGVDATAFIILLLGVLSILLEVKVGHGGPAIVGSALIALGTLMLYRREYFIWTFNYTSTVASGLALIIVITGIIGLYLHKIREVLLKKKSIMDLNVIVGKEAIVKSRITPDKPGVVLAMSDLWTAYSDEVIEEGERVKIIGIDGIKVYVKKVR